MPGVCPSLHETDVSPRTAIRAGPTACGELLPRSRCPGVRFDTGQCRPVSRQHPEVSSGIFLLYDAEEDRPITFHDVCALRDRRSSLAAQPESVLQSAARNTGDGQRVSLVMGVHDDAVEVGFVAQYLEAGESAPLVADEECLDEIAWASALRRTVLVAKLPVATQGAESARTSALRIKLDL
jgi:hypothetical protein